MYKKFFVVLLIVILCFAVVKCKEDNEEKINMIIGEWYIASEDLYDLKPVFKEDGSCIIDGQPFTWEVEELRNKVTEFRVYDDGKEVYKVDLAYGEECVIYIAERCEHGFAATEGRYYKSSNYIEQE